MKDDATHASAALATNNSRQTPLCWHKVKVLQIIKLINYLKELTMWEPNMLKLP